MRRSGGTGQCAPSSEADVTPLLPAPAPLGGESPRDRLSLYLLPGPTLILSPLGGPPLPPHWRCGLPCAHGHERSAALTP